ncbi:MAG: 2-dehydro-3-deoxy-D-gluconate 5-dehydrogenase KduD [Chloroflexota bacterium]|nr:2-dehydro-3-deoxy-D-gluconate 5-dehydrogenase KduD [Chloroflexota bacterium]
MTTDAFRLDGRVAVVTGAARGLGQGLAVGLAQAGADVAMVDVLPLAETRRRIEELGRRSVAMDQDLREMTPELAAAMIEKVVSALGRIDILVNNAGILRRAPALDVAAADWRDVVEINLSTPFYLSQAAARHWVAAARGGKIINMASMLSFQGGLMVPSYTATKSAIAGLTRALANEWASRGINVNALAPGYMATEMTSGIRDDPARSQAMLDRIPAGRWGTPEDLAGPVVFLASEAASYLHGVILPVDGGWLVR